MTDRQYILIVGAGIIGASIAWHLARASARVTVVEAGQPALLRHPTSELGRRLGERHRVAALVQRPRRLEPCRPGADDEYGVVRALRRNELGVPVAPPLLARRRFQASHLSDALDA